MRYECHLIKMKYSGMEKVNLIQNVSFIRQKRRLMNKQMEKRLNEYSHTVVFMVN